MESLRGKLLIAPPTLADPNFVRTVVLVAAHDENGALGLVLNRQLETPLSEISPVLDALAEPGSMLHHGGPLARRADRLWNGRLPGSRLRAERPGKGRAARSRVRRPLRLGAGPARRRA